MLPYRGGSRRKDGSGVRAPGGGSDQSLVHPWPESSGKA